MKLTPLVIVQWEIAAMWAVSRFDLVGPQVAAWVVFGGIEFSVPLGWAGKNARQTTGRERTQITSHYLKQVLPRDHAQNVHATVCAWHALMKLADIAPETSARDRVTYRELPGIEMNNGHGETMQRRRSIIMFLCPGIKSKANLPVCR
jgi:hypothetical protein